MGASMEGDLTIRQRIQLLFTEETLSDVEGGDGGGGGDTSTPTTSSSAGVGVGVPTTTTTTAAAASLALTGPPPSSSGGGGGGGGGAVYGISTPITTTGRGGGGGGELHGVAELHGAGEGGVTFFRLKRIDNNSSGGEGNGEGEREKEARKEKGEGEAALKRILADQLKIIALLSQRLQNQEERTLKIQAELSEEKASKDALLRQHSKVEEDHLKGLQEKEKVIEELERRLQEALNKPPLGKGSPPGLPGGPQRNLEDDNEEEGEGEDDGIPRKRRKLNGEEEEEEEVEVMGETSSPLFKKPSPPQRKSSNNELQLQKVNNNLSQGQGSQGQGAPGRPSAFSRPFPRMVMLPSGENRRRFITSSSSPLKLEQFRLVTPQNPQHPVIGIRNNFLNMSRPIARRFQPPQVLLTPTSSQSQSQQSPQGSQQQVSSPSDSDSSLRSQNKASLVSLSEAPSEGGGEPTSSSAAPPPPPVKRRRGRPLGFRPKKKVPLPPPALDTVLSPSGEQQSSNSPNFGGSVGTPERNGGGMTSGEEPSPQQPRFSKRGRLLKPNRARYSPDPDSPQLQYHGSTSTTPSSSMNASTSSASSKFMTTNKSYFVSEPFVPEGYIGGGGKGGGDPNDLKEDDEDNDKQPPPRKGPENQRPPPNDLAADFEEASKENEKIQKGIDLKGLHPPPPNHLEKEGNVLKKASSDNKKEEDQPQQGPLKFVEVPQWRIITEEVEVSLLPQGEGGKEKKNCPEEEDDMSDEAFLKRHQKPEVQEKQRKRWDAQMLREESYKERMKRKQLERERQKELRRQQRKRKGKSSTTTEEVVNPSADEIKAIYVGSELPVGAFGQTLPINEKVDFNFCQMIGLPSPKPPPRPDDKKKEISGAGEEKGEGRKKKDIYEYEEEEGEEKEVKVTRPVPAKVTLAVIREGSCGSEGGTETETDSVSSSSCSDGGGEGVEVVVVLEGPLKKSSLSSPSKKVPPPSGAGRSARIKFVIPNNPLAPAPAVAAAVAKPRVPEPAGGGGGGTTLIGGGGGSGSSGANNVNDDKDKEAAKERTSQNS